MDTSKPATSTNIKTDILDLNFDCLWTVFEYLDLRDLCAVADVCRRFRANARAVYAYSKLKENLNIFSDLCHPQEYSNVILRRTSAVLRNFGSLTKRMHVDGACYDVTLTEQQIFQNRLVKLLATYCRGTLNELTLNSFVMSDRVIKIIQPVLRRVRKLSIQDSQCGIIDWKPLKRLAPKLNELKFSCNLLRKKQRFDEWHHSIPSMKSLSFKYLHVMEHDIDQIFQQNQQLKKIELVFCQFLCDAIFKSIVKYMPKIAEIHFRTENPTRPEYITYLSRMQNLKSLKLSGFTGNFKCVVIAVAKIAIEDLHLKLTWDDHHHNAHQLIEEIVKLKSLKKLRLDDCRYLMTDHLLQICDQLPELEELQLKFYHRYYKKNEFDLSAMDLAEMVKRADKLKMIRLHGFNLKQEAHIDANIFMGMVNVVEQRRNRDCVELELLQMQTVSVDIDKELARAYEDILKINIIDYY